MAEIFIGCKGKDYRLDIVVKYYGSVHDSTVVIGWIGGIR